MLFFFCFESTGFGNLRNLKIILGYKLGKNLGFDTGVLKTHFEIAVLLLLGSAENPEFLNYFLVYSFSGLKLYVNLWVQN